MAQGEITEDDIGGLLKRTDDANLALLNGDVEGFLELIVHSADYTLMNPFGGEIERGFEPSPQRIQGMKEFFKSGSGVVELVGSYASGDLAVLVVIERQRVTVGNLPEQDWSLRVTLVYRREGPDWTLVHRHADPIVASITVEEAARLARGEAPA